MAVTYKFDADRFTQIFGKVAREEEPGAYRKCRTCGGWHRRGSIPHNCRPEAPRRNPDLSMPQLTPSFDTFMAGVPGDPDAEVIGSRNEKREYMKRRDLAEYDAGVTNPNAQWVREREHKNQIAETVKRFYDTDKDYWTPEEQGVVAETRALETGGQDVDLSNVEIIDGKT